VLPSIAKEKTPAGTKSKSQASHRRNKKDRLKMPNK